MSVEGRACNMKDCKVHALNLLRKPVLLIIKKRMTIIFPLQAIISRIILLNEIKLIKK